MSAPLPESTPGRGRSPGPDPLADAARVATAPGRRPLAIAAVAALAIGGGLLLSLGGDRGADDALTSEIRQVPATTSASDTADTGSSRITVATTEPVRIDPLVLGEETGLWLFHGGADPLQRLDLDTGELDRYGLRAQPVAAVGSELIVAAANATIGRVGLDDPSEQAQGWQAARPARADDPGRLWLLFDEDPPRATLVDVESDVILERLRLPDGTVAVEATDGGPIRLAPGPELASNGDGVFDRPAADGSDYRRLGDGRLIVFDQRLALVETCDAAPVCERRWFERADWRPAASPVASPLGERLDDLLAPGPVTTAELLAGGRWLTVVDAGGATFLFSLDATRSIEPVELNPAAAFAISPDGRWLALTARSGGNTSVDIVDVDLDAVVATVNAFHNPDGGELLFVERR